MHEDADTASSATAPAIARVQLDAYPRLCGLPVTIERLDTTRTAAASERTASARPVRRKRTVAHTVLVLLVAAATVLAVASDAHAQPAAPSMQAGSR
jgi:hypothetical protein